VGIFGKLLENLKKRLGYEIFKIVSWMKNKWND
jgi:hypothetical protein